MTEHSKRDYEQNVTAASSTTPSSSSQQQQVANGDPKSVQELTNFVQITLQQMQDKFQNMSDQIINRNILLIINKEI